MEVALSDHTTVPRGEELGHPVAGSRVYSHLLDGDGVGVKMNLPAQGSGMGLSSQLLGDGVGGSQV